MFKSNHANAEFFFFFFELQFISQFSIKEEANYDYVLILNSCFCIKCDINVSNLN